MDELPHHVQQDLCTTRPLYRQGRKLTAVKVYTIANESSHLLIFGVPDLKLRNELKSALNKYGVIIKLIELTDFPNTEDFTKVYHAQYEDIRNARYAKRKLDATSFYGGVLHIAYAPEKETVEELKTKLEHRKMEVLKRLKFSSGARHKQASGAMSVKKIASEHKIKNYATAAVETETKQVYGPQRPVSATFTKKTSCFIPRQVKLDKTSNKRTAPRNSTDSPSKRPS